MNDIISIIPHTEKSFAVYTNSVFRYMDSLNNLGGMFESKINHSESGEKYMGWIFYIDKKEEIQNWINSGCPVVTKKKKVKQSFEKILFPPKIKNISPVNIEGDKIKSLEKIIETLLSKMKLLEEENSLLSNRLNLIENEVQLLKTTKNEIEVQKKVECKIETEEEYEIFDNTEIEEQNNNFILY